MPARSGRPLWRCGACGRSFANRNQAHSCGRHSLEDHFAEAAPHVRKIFDAFHRLLRESGEVDVVPEKTRIAFQARMSFAQLTLRRRWATGHLVLARRIENPPFYRIDSLSPRNHVHHFRLSAPADVEALRPYAAEAAAVGRQEHLG